MYLDDLVWATVCDCALHLKLGERICADRLATVVVNVVRNVNLHVVLEV